MRNITVALLLLVVIVACKSSDTSQVSNANAEATPTPSPSPKTPQEKSAQSEKDVQEQDGFENRTKARQAVVDYVNSTMPNQIIEGVSLLSYTGNLYTASVDLSSGKKHQTISLLVRMYVKDNGETYWKADKLTEDDKRLFISRRAYRFKELFRNFNQLIADYNDLYSEYEELQGKVELLENPPEGRY